MSMRLTALSAVVLTVFSSAALAAAADLCGPQTSSLEFVIDDSYSMGEVYQSDRKGENAETSLAPVTKLEYAMRFVASVAEIIPADVSMMSAAGTFAPSARLLSPSKRNAEELTKALSDLKVSPSTVSSNSLDKKDLDYFARRRKAATVLFFITDGDLDKGAYDPYKVLQTFYQNNPKSCVHFISLAQNKTEEALIERLRQTGACSTVTSMAEVIAEPNRLNELVQTNVYRDCSAKTRLVISGIPFIKKADTLDKKAVTMLEKSMWVLESRSTDEAITVVGWTDAEGDSVYNKRVALSRAQAVKDYFVSQGIDERRINVLGAGESDKFSNESEVGRRLNRRVDVILGR